MATYPFVRLAEAQARVAARGVEMLDFGIGEPREETPAFIREALVAALAPMSTYPSADGLPELRAAIAGWAQRRFGARLDPATQIMPTLGSKEAIYSLAQVLDGDTVVVPTPAYPVYERGAQFAGKRVVALPLREADGWLPDLHGVDWDRVAVLWLNYPNNPTAATAPLEFYERAAALARRHGFVLASDEAYSELYFGDAPPASALQVSDLAHVAVFNTLSKRSSMPGYRSGFVAGDPDDRRRAQALPAERRRRAAGVRPARRRRRLGRRGARGGDARALPGQARRPAAGAGGGRAAQRGRRRDVLPLARRRRADADALRRRAARAGRRPDARLVLRRRRARASCGSRSSRRPRRASGRRRSSVVRVQRRVEAGPAAGARQRLDRAGA